MAVPQNTFTRRITIAKKKRARAQQCERTGINLNTSMSCSIANVSCNIDCAIEFVLHMHAMYFLKAIASRILDWCVRACLRAYISAILPISIASFEANRLIFDCLLCIFEIQIVYIIRGFWVFPVLHVSRTTIDTMQCFGAALWVLLHHYVGDMLSFIRIQKRIPNRMWMRVHPTERSHNLTLHIWFQATLHGI